MYLRGKIKQTNLTLTEIWPISDRLIKQKYYCITVHYRTVCASENPPGKTDQPGQQSLGHLELFSNYILRADAKLNPCCVIHFISKVS